ncbi:hypothetical protein E4T42_09393 [Aureobasidium subglaciale]|nr:hypothetical protein E4T42_09393 [Aureobasidium subglaciale]
MANSDDEPSWKPAVDAVRKYYTFLSNDLGAIPSDCIVEPPPEGWPSITQDSLVGLEKTEAVVELLRHMPYIEPSDDYNTQVAFGTSVIDYRQIGAYKVAEGKRHQFIPVGNKEFPPHVVVLTADGEDYYGSLLLLDTEKGTATDYQPQAPRKKGVPDPETTSEIWRFAETSPVAELLASWEQKFRTLEWTANPFNAEGGIMLRYDRMTDEVRQIYRDHGWPDNFRREDCRIALQIWNRTIGNRLSQPDHNLHEITRQPPGPHGDQTSLDSEDESDGEDGYNR